MSTPDRAPFGHAPFGHAPFDSAAFPGAVSDRIPHPRSNVTRRRRGIPQPCGDGRSRERVAGAVVRWPIDPAVLLPAVTEHRRLPAASAATVGFPSAQLRSSRVGVVDNGSRDAIAGVVVRSRPSAVQIVAVGGSEPGQGAAVRPGIRTRTARYAGFADPSTPPATRTAVMAALDGGAPAVIASRRVPGSRVPVARRLVQRAGGSVFRSDARTVRPDIRDTRCGSTSFPRRRSTRFAARDVALLAHLLGDGGRVVEIPVGWSDDRHSTSRPLRDGVPAARPGLAAPRGVPGPPAAR